MAGMHASTTNVSRWLLSFAVAVCLSAGCSKMDPKECAKLRESAYDLINSPGNCETDADCRATAWPGCPKATSAKYFDNIQKMKEQADKGKCEDKKLTCQPVPPVYCQEGLCAFKYKNPPLPGADQIKIE